MFASELLIKIKQLFTGELFTSMNETDLTLDKYSDDKQELFVFTAAIPNMTWPEVLETKNGIYRFRSNEAMPKWAVGNYLGYAKYVRSDE